MRPPFDTLIPPLVLFVKYYTASAVLSAPAHVQAGAYSYLFWNNGSGFFDPVEPLKHPWLTHVRETRKLSVVDVK